MGLLDPPGLTPKQADARYPQASQSRGLVTEHTVYLGDFTTSGTSAAPTPSNAKFVVAGATGLYVPISARIPTTCQLIRFNVTSPAGLGTNDTDYWQFTVIRRRPNGPPLSAAATATTTAAVVIGMTKTQASGGHSMPAHQTWPLTTWKSWDQAAATLQEEDTLQLYMQGFGAPALLDRLAVTYALQELS